jgi:hypothetical protein
MTRKDSSYERAGIWSLSQVPVMRILLGFSAEVGKEDMFKSTVGNESLHESMVLRVVNICHMRKFGC